MVSFFKKGKFFGFFHKQKLAYVDGKIVSEIFRAIIACKQCGQKLKVPILENKKLRITCSKCKHDFLFDCQLYKQRKKILAGAIYGVLLIVLVADLAAPIYFYSRISSFDLRLKNKYEEEFKQRQPRFSKEMQDLKVQHAATIDRINSKDLRIEAEEHYANIWEERRNYVSKYAITPREKAQLEMLALSKDRTKRIEDIIKGIASKTAPRNSEIYVYVHGDKYGLDINFDMSELSSGEEGTRTKHRSIDSLKKDVIRLISKVTNDVYQFCQNLDLDSISIGCKHYVMEYEDNIYRGEANSVLYKIRIDKSDLSELENNPFLDIYSTTKYFKVEEDAFPNLEISIRESK